MKTISPTAAPGEAATPEASTSYSACGSKVGCSSASSVSGSIVASASGLVEQPLADRIDGEAHGRLRRALGVARLEHVQLPLFDRELGVLHVAVMALELAQDLHQLRMDRGQDAIEIGDVERVAHARDDVLALGVDEEVTAGLGRPGDLVAAEGDA